MEPGVPRTSLSASSNFQKLWTTIFKPVLPGTCGAANMAGADKLGSLQACPDLADHFVRLKATARQTHVQQDGPPMLGYNADHVVWLTEMKDAALSSQPELAVLGMQKTAENVATFQLACNRTAAMVALDTIVPGTFSDNLLTCVPEELLSLEFSSQPPFDMYLFEQTLTVASLADTLTAALLG